MADITRDQFDSSKGVTKKVFQKGKHLTDADLNEQISVVTYRERRLLSSLAEGLNKRFGDGFKVVKNNNQLTVTLLAGSAIFHLTSNQAIRLELDSDYSLTGFDAWSEARTDYIYVDIYEHEVTSSDDPTLINPQVGEETCVDIRVSYTINISKGTAPSNPPTNHTYITIATIYKLSGSYIEDEDITIELSNYYIDTPTMPESVIWLHATESHTSVDAPLLEDSSESYKVTSSSGETTINAIRIPYVWNPKVKYLAIYAEVWRDDAAQSGFMVLDSFIYGGLQIWIPKTKTKVVAYCPVTGNPSDKDQFVVTLRLSVTGTNVNAYMRKPIIVEGYGSYDIKRYSDN